MGFDEKQFLISTEQLVDALAKMQAEGAVGFPILSAQGCDVLIKDIEELSFRAGRRQVGEGDKAVFQDFQIALNFEGAPQLSAFTSCFEKYLNAAFEAIDPKPFPTPFKFNDRAALIYEEGSKGISPHRDLQCFQAVIAIVTLAGEADFYICDDRQKNNRKLFKATTGQMILMRGVNYAGLYERPFHYVENITGRRVGFGLRYQGS